MDGSPIEKYNNYLRRTCTLLQLSAKHFTGIFAITHANLKLITKCYDANDIKNANLIIAATDDKEVNNQVAKDAHIDQWVNNVSDKEQSDFYNVSQFTVDNVTVQISSEGTDYYKVKTLTTEIKEYLNCRDEEDIND